MRTGSGPAPAVEAAERRELRLDVSATLAEAGPLEIAATLVLPGRGAPRAVLACLPGGFLSRRYYDLEVDGDRRFSFAEHMAGLGWATLALDHLGVGESSRPDDGWRLDVEAIARANQTALEAVLGRFASEAGSRPRTVGVGHSMGSCLSVVQQASHGPHEALVLFSFTTAGLRPFLQGRELDLADDPDAARANVTELARERFASPYPPAADDAEAGTRAAFGVGTAPPEAERALHAAATNLLAIPGLLAMLPAGYRPWADEVRVPTFVAVGDHDLHGLDRVPAMLPKAPEVETFTLDDCWHCHHVANGRERLWNRVAGWLDGVIESAA
ncbi:MAG: alpha/beta fold hydrolase [Myxococcota bacterium]|nr:alpha/beta fold hydrolase [Myxococcota bacterium]